ncbi:transglycosylase SLT domain-containing protein [Thiolapillus brandeum]|nr:transglycosylase SLT domain-containing protein [Thiolapillus brandeum]
MFRLTLFLSLMLAVTFSQASLTDQARRKAFQGAEKLALAGKPLPHQLESLLKGYPLYPYLEYARLKSRLSRVSATQVEAFLKKYADTPLASLLRSRWLSVLAKRNDWNNYLRFYQPQNNVARQCHYLHALIQTGRKEQAFGKVSALWLYGKSRPKACDPVFKAWRQAGKLTRELIWQRIGLAMDRGNIQLARYLKKSLPAAEHRWVDTWIQIHHKPQLAFSDKLLKKPHSQRFHILRDAAYRQIRKDPLAAIDYWNKLQQRFSFSPMDKHLVDRKLALWLVRKDAPEAIRFLTKLQPCGHDTQLQEALARSALLHNDWNQVVRRIQEMPEEEQHTERWRYWMARALEQTGKRQQANALYAELASERSYYGFLSADRLGRNYRFAPRKTTVDPSIDNRISGHSAVPRIRELLALERWVDARREWRLLTSGLSSEEYKAAARLAKSWNWHDQAIFTLAKSDYWDDLELRFPLEHTQQVRHFSGRNGLDMSWVFGVIRQESAFNPSVRSYAGAIGLMQLMPATARYVSKKLLKRKKTPLRKDLITPETNIELGTAYLADVLASLGENPVLATAAYNAGPHRVKRWLPRNRLPADIWVELIPFKETRGYVQRVFTYATIYDYRLKRNITRLSDRMLPIQGTQAERTAQSEVEKNTTL